MKSILFLSISAFFAFLAKEIFILMWVRSITQAAYYHPVTINVDVFTLFAWETCIFIIYLLFFYTNITFLTMIIDSSFTRVTTTFITTEYIFYKFLWYAFITFIAMKEFFFLICKLWCNCCIYRSEIYLLIFLLSILYIYRSE